MPVVDNSLKNIPIPPEHVYRKGLLQKVESLVRRMRWKAIFFLNPQSEAEEGGEFYGFKSKATPPRIDEMKAFEDDLTSLVDNVTFRKVTEPFQTKLSNDIKSLTSSDNIVVKADKTRNMYALTKDQYSKLLRDNITKTYRIADDGMYQDINTDAKQLAQSMEPPLDERMEVMAKSEAFITLKDHKERFTNDLPCRLINPAKPEMGRVSKAILERVTKDVQSATRINLWKNTASVLDWFSALESKDQRTFVVFDIVEYYPSITEQLLTSAIEFAKQYSNISQQEVDMVLHARRSLLFDGQNTWVKRSSGGAFDVTMGSFDGAEVCQLVGAFLLTKLAAFVDPASIGLYRDDGLATLKGASGSVADRTRKNIVSLFKSFGLRITIDTNIKTTNFLDVTLDLKTGTYKPYRKPGDTPLYLNMASNHPPTIIKNLPKSINKRLTSISASEDIFEEAKPIYAAALSKSGFLPAMQYRADEGEGMARAEEKKRKKRKRNIIWFNPPYSKNVKTNVGAVFLKLIKRHFPAGSPLGKIFNKNSIKISYSCLPNVSAIIKGHNQAKLHPTPPEKPCNCRDKANCPLRGACQTDCVVYEAAVGGANDPKYYIGSAETPFKLRHANHKTSMRHEKYRNSTELSSYVWSLKNQGQEYNVSWNVKRRAKSYSPTTKRCNLCLTEKLEIITADKATLLNTRCDLIAKCRHSTRYQLSKYSGVT